MDAALSAHLAYVVTGDAAVDETSGSALDDAVAGARTSARPLSSPSRSALDPARDELSFYPLIYWPIVAGRRSRSPSARRRASRPT